jgi:NADH-quinone oxidoreductase subunit H
MNWAVIPFDNHSYFININLSLLYLFAISSLAIYGVLLSGWASNSKYSFLGSIRSAAQMISYEVCIGFVLLIVILISGSFNLIDIVQLQTKNNWLFFFSINFIFYFFNLYFSWN